MPGPINYKVSERYYIKVIKYLSFHKVEQTLQSKKKKALQSNSVI